MTRTVTETGRILLVDGISLVAQTIGNTYHDGRTYTYDTHDFDGLAEGGVEALAQLAVLLKNIPDEGALDLSYDDLFELLKDYARDIAEDAELPFTFEDRDGDSNTYTPASLWESSGGCEWETSAQEGYDYGWNV
jgi:hypothetical protein